eukprot:10220789-Heterocapsa_arctica.AAC.1
MLSRMKNTTFSSEKELRTLRKELDLKEKTLRRKEHKDGDYGWKTHGHTRKYIYIWIKGTRSTGPLIVIPGGSAQIADRLKEAEKAWGGLWAVEADELPEFEEQPMKPITED